jgi:hypothetical protein
MTEAEILTVRNDLTEIVLSVVSVSFAMISSYIVGLWLFLKNAPFTLRALAFFMLTFGLAFLGALTAGVNDLMMGTERAWSRLGQTATGIPGFGSETPAYLMGLSLYEAAAFLGGLAFLAIYLALAYLTFLYRWPAAERQ